MSTQYVLHAESRTEQGKGASRRLRHQGKLPAIVYGAGKEPVSITLEHNEVLRHTEDEAFFSQILGLETEGKTEQVVLRDMQRHPSRSVILHMDLQRILEDQELKVVIPFHFMNAEECVGVKQSGGVISHVANEAEILCLPRNLPEYIEVDLENIDIGGSVHLSEITLPEGVVFTELMFGDDNDYMVASVHAPVVHQEEEDLEPTTDAGETAADTSGDEESAD